jgi:succinyl-CoA synthetase alpha subunit/GNAT superfamily N-acetyltransferase
MSAYEDSDGLPEGAVATSYALLTDGTCVAIRPATPRDWQSVHDFGDALGPASIYRRFFSMPARPGALLADLACAPTGAGRARSHGALLAVLDGTVIGLADWYRARDPREAEVAFAVSDAFQHRGVATLLAEHLLDVADRVGVRRLTAVTQGENRAMLDVFTALGLPVRTAWDSGTVLLTIDLDLDAAGRVALLDTAARRERIAGEASLRSLLAPGSIAVIGDPDAPGTRRIRAHLRDFPGLLPAARPDGADLPEVGPDLAVLTCPPEAVVEAARRCAASRVKALVVTASGLGESVGAELLDVCHQAGMRLLGPGSLGVANPGGSGAVDGSGAVGTAGSGGAADGEETRPTGFSALIAPTRPRPGPAGVAVQSGGVGLSLLSRLERLGIGVSTFAAVGDKYDVSANDLLMHWEQDPATRFALLHVASFGNPRKFARTARRLARRIPVLAVDPEQSPSEARTALYKQAGITALPSLGVLVCAAALAAHQPAPRGRRVYVIGNARGIIGLAAQACAKAGLDIAGEVDLTPAATAEDLGEAVAQAVRPPDGTGEPADISVLITLAPAVPETPTLDIAIGRMPEGVPVLAVLADQPESVIVQTFGTSGETVTSPRIVPCFNDASNAAAALAAAFAATEARNQPEPDDPLAARLDAAALDTVRSIIEHILKDASRGRALDPTELSALLGALGATVLAQTAVGAGTEAGVGAGAGAAAEAGAEVVAGTGLGGDVVVTAWQDLVFGPLITCAAHGSGGSSRTLLAPASLRDLADLAQAATGRPSPTLVDLLARIAILVDTCPDVASARLEVSTRNDKAAASVVGGEVTVVQAHRVDPYLRRLRRAPVE